MRLDSGRSVHEAVVDGVATAPAGLRMTLVAPLADRPLPDLPMRVRGYWDDDHGEHEVEGLAEADGDLQLRLTHLGATRLVQRRGFVRVRITVPIEVELADDRGSGWTLNLSESGALLVVHGVSLEVGDDVVVLLTADGPVTLPATVTRTAHRDAACTAAVTFRSAESQARLIRRTVLARQVRQRLVLGE